MKILIIGSNGALGWELRNGLPHLSETEKQPLSVICASHSQIEITNASNTFEAIARTMPDVIINCAAFTDVDACETNIGKAYAVNADGAKTSHWREKICMPGSSISALIMFSMALRIHRITKQTCLAHFRCMADRTCRRGGSAGNKRQLYHYSNFTALWTA